MNRMEEKHTFELTESEIVVIREMVRKFPASHALVKDYAPELENLDRMMTDKLVEIFEENMGLKS